MLDEKDLQAIRGIMADQKTEILGVIADQKTEILGAMAEQKTEILGIIADQKTEILGAMAEQKTEILGVIADQKTEIFGAMDDLKREILEESNHNMSVLIETKIESRLNLLSEGIQDIQEKLIPRSRVDELEEEVKFLKSIVRQMNEDLQILKKAN